MHARLSAVLAALFVLSIAPASAQDTAGAVRVVTDPVPAKIRRESDQAVQPLHLTATGKQKPGANDEASLDLQIAYTDSQIYNPASGRYDHVRLRSYRSPDTQPRIPFVAPTISASPGETVRIGLDNRLPKQPGCTPPNINTPHCFNSTNLHAHGLWVSPAGNSDNVLLTIRPGVEFEYEYNIPADHPAGTFWYHPHLHGSTALQVSSGMAGALVIHGDRLPGAVTNGDVDTLLRDLTGKPLPERVVLFQQVQYACRDANGNIKVKKDANGKVIAWVCDPGDVGGIEGYDQFGPGSWEQSGRHTSINGEILPVFKGASPGLMERWRLIHAGVRNTISLQFRQLRAGVTAVPQLSADAQQNWIDQNCTGPVLPQFEIAADGLTHSKMIVKTQNVLQPGYRSDVLMAFPAPGHYCVIDAAAPASGSVGNAAEDRQLLGLAEVGAGPTIPVASLPKLVADNLVAAANYFMPVAAKPRVVDGLRNGLGLQAFVPHPTITDNEVTGKQDVVFNIDTSKSPAVFMVNGKPYDPDAARDLVLGGVDEWTLTSSLANHPFHIHVNPFQIVRILDPQGVDVSVTGEKDDPQYADLKGTWHDTLFVKQGYHLMVRTRYERYIGEYVLHCHILDHEDQGMMQNVRVLLPDGDGGMAQGHH